ncbi:DUF2125 domain-containing protein [Dongia sedimenti]|uniref:DUF2125 domain-containing protein n=1 Tax=Dongia sedimenti TaxID=3064282 RepID=A0ABU0YJC2_9PROT|nr:DUF2125 domain-containing protein [Rhodospirillaceae bacterium R-7]
MKARTRIIAAIAAGLVLLGGYAGYWFTVAAQLEKGVDDWVALQRQAGMTVDFERTSVSGFPFDFRTTFGRPHMAGTIGGQAFDWHGPDVEAKLSPLDLHAMTFSGPGHHVIDLGQGPAVVDVADLSARVRLDGFGQLSSLAVKFSGAQAALPDGRSLAAASGEASLDAAATPPKSEADPLLQFSATAKDLRLPEGTVLLTADPLGEVALAGTVKGPMPMAPLRQALASWRDAGGTIEVTDFALAQATLSVAGSATVALDETLQPIVAANLKARGLSQTIDLLASQRRLHPEDALKMKLFVKGAERDAPGGYKEVATGLTIQGGYLFWGPFKIARVPPIRWP